MMAMRPVVESSSERGDKARRRMTFSMTFERHEPNVVYLHGDASAAGAAQVGEEVQRFLDQDGADLVLDLTEVSSISAAFVVTLNELAATAMARRVGITLRLPSGHLPDLTSAPIHRGVRVELTEPIPRGTMRKSPPADEPRRTVGSPGTARREGRGYIASYGQDRRCAFDSCETRLSRYNARDRCELHRLPER